MPRHPALDQANDPSPMSGSGWGPWSHEAMDVAEAGPLVSQAFWIGEGLSVLLWSGVTLLALQWL
jgi:hypothetical protein